MGNNTNNVSFGKPNVAGSIYSAPLGSVMPKNAVDPLDNVFKCLGYVSEDGITNENTPESESIKAWGGDVVLMTQSEKNDTFTYTLIESTNIEVLKEVYGKDNVAGNLETGITITANSKEYDSHAIVIDMILKGGVLKRILIPNAKVSELGEVVYGDEDPIGYETTVQALPDERGNTHYEFIQKQTTTAAK